MNSVPERLAAVRARMQAAATRAGRRLEDVTLVAVTKTVPWDQIQPWVAAGQTEFGENRVQEALTKFIDGDKGRKISGRLSLIGPLQSNKAKKAVQFFDLIQSLDRLDLAKEIDRHARDVGKTMTCLVEVKISDESSKSGLAPEALPDFLAAAQQFPHVAIQGLMGIPPASATGEQARPYFARLRAIFEKTKLKILSMGMSSDFEIAIEEGSTMVRLGRVLFGERQ